jgi:3-isopropylmalate/(R)-2-methylmalate dehydratase small subunit
MTPFVKHKGIAAALLRPNVDTDAIIPSREMKTVGKRGLADGLFAGWRYAAQVSREPNPEFVLNKPQFQNASILLSGANFGCGSSREHAVWALAEYGFRCIIAPSFGAIFRNNCIRNGLLPVTLDEPSVQILAESPELEVDLERGVITASDGREIAFSLEPGARNLLLEGLDAIGLTLKRQRQIDAHIVRDRQQRPWVYL